MNSLLPLAYGFLLGCAVTSIAGAALYAYQRKRYGRFLSFIAHELNTPLTSVNMTTLNFVRGVFGPVPKDQESWLLLLKEQSTRLSTLVGDLRDFIHMEFHRDIRLYPEPIDLVALVKETVESMQGSTARSGTVIQLELPEDLPAVLADPDRFSRALGDLLFHCRKFRTKGPLTVSARVLAAGSGGDNPLIELLLGYEGPGMTRNQAAQMMDFFYPVDRPKSAVLSCVGLGMGVCKAVLEKGGASMSFDVDEGGKSRILILLPSAPKENAGAITPKKE